MIIGHQKIIEFLNKSIENNRLAHAYLFVGQEHLGKRTIALEFAKMLQCEFLVSDRVANQRIFSGLNPPALSKKNPLVRARTQINEFNSCGKCVSCLEIDKNAHPDILIVEPEIIVDVEKEKTKEKEISIEKIREIQRKIGLFSYRGKYKIIIIDQAERMTRQAANALLKNLEEPSAKTIFILISSAPQAFLSTIVSRCLTIKFPAIKKEEIERGINKIFGTKISKEKINRIVKLSGNRPGLAINYLREPKALIAQEEIIVGLEELFRKDLSFRFRFAENLSKDASMAKETIDAWLIFFRDLMLEKTECENLLVWNQDLRKEKGKWDSINIMGLKDIIKKIIKTKNILSNSSFNARLALEVLMLNF